MSNEAIELQVKIKVILQEYKQNPTNTFKAENAIRQLIDQQIKERLNSVTESDIELGAPFFSNDIRHNAFRAGAKWILNLLKKK